jgi:hypothetical protein
MQSSSSPLCQKMLSLSMIIKNYSMLHTLWLSFEMNLPSLKFLEPHSDKLQFSFCRWFLLIHVSFPPLFLQRWHFYPWGWGTTCSKGYLYTWRTSTVTPIPRGTPAPEGRGFLPHFQTLETFLSFWQTAGHAHVPSTNVLEVARKALGSRGRVSFPVPSLATLQLVSLPRSHHSWI